MTGESLKALRIRLGLNQKEFAAKIGTTKHRVCEWERGKKNMGKAYQLIIQTTFKEELKQIINP